MKILKPAAQEKAWYCAGFQFHFQSEMQEVTHLRLKVQMAMSTSDNEQQLPGVGYVPF